MELKGDLHTMKKINTGKSGRVLYLYNKLLQGQILEKGKLAEQFDVNERSIQRDLDSIRDFLDREAIEDGYRPRLVYDFRKRGYRLDKERGEVFQMRRCWLSAKSCLGAGLLQREK